MIVVLPVHVVFACTEFFAEIVVICLSLWQLCWKVHKF